MDQMSPSQLCPACKPKQSWMNSKGKIHLPVDNRRDLGSPDYTTTYLVDMYICGTCGFVALITSPDAQPAHHPNIRPQ
jgi:hypothetical protein